MRVRLRCSFSFPIVSGPLSTLPCIRTRNFGVTFAFGVAFAFDVIFACGATFAAGSAICFCVARPCVSCHERVGACPCLLRRRLVLLPIGPSYSPAAKCRCCSSANRCSYSAATCCNGRHASNCRSPTRCSAATRCSTPRARSASCCMSTRRRSAVNSSDTLTTIHWAWRS